MNKFSNKLLVRGSLFVLFAIAPVASYGQDKSTNNHNTENVNVVNTPNVKVVNTPNVKITNTPKVLNGNDSNIFQDRRELTTDLNADAVSFTVPLGKRLVIEFASIRTTVGQGEQVQAFIRAGNGLADAIHPILMSFQQTVAGQDNYVGGQLMRMYAEPGTTVELLVSRVKGGAAPSPNARITGSVSGYLVDLQ